MPDLRRKLIAASRAVHVYASLLALALLLFFAATGFMLNHPDAFGLSAGTSTEQQGAFPPELLGSADQAAVVDRLRRDHAPLGTLDSYDASDEEVRAVFKSPGRRQEVVVTRETGALRLTRETTGLAGRLADLHKGAAAGEGWKRLLDAASIGLALISLTGLLFWFALPRKRRLGVAALLLGAVLTIALYVALVP